MSPLQIQWDRIRRRWVLILVIGIVAAAGSLGASLLQGSTYTGRAALTIVSQDRAPEQDTVLAQGYADYFNQASSQEVLRQSAGVGDDVALNARIAAASPIVYIEATTDSPEVASDAATRMAVALRDDVNASLGGEAQQQQIDVLNQQLAAARAAGNNVEANRLQEQINEIPSTNQLQDLQLNAGVASNATNAGRYAGTALIGGLLLGVLLAMALGRFENRIVTPNEVSDRLGLQVLAVVGGKRRSAEDARRELLRSLMGLTNANGMPSPGALAITGPTSARASKTRIALSLAGLRALQGQTTLLVQTDFEADLGSSELASMAGVADFLAERGDSRIDGKVFSNGRALLVAPPGSRRDDLFALFSRSHLRRLLGQGTALADLVIVDAPPAQSVEGQVVCATADRSLLVVEEGQTRARDARAALDALTQAGGTPLGVILVRNPGQLSDPGFLAERAWTPVRLPAGPVGARPGPPPGGSPAAPNGVARGPAAPGPNLAPPPADRTAPISQQALEEARAAVARGDAQRSSEAPKTEGTNGTSVKAAHGPSVRTAGPTPGTNGSAVDRSGSGESASGPANGAAAPSESRSAAGPQGPRTPGAKPSPGGKPSPAGKSSPGGPASGGTGGPGGSASTSAPGGSTSAGAQGRAVGPAGPPAGGASAKPGQTPSPKPGQTPSEPDGAPAPSVHTRRGAGGKPSPSPKPGGAPGAGGRGPAPTSKPGNTADGQDQAAGRSSQSGQGGTNGRSGTPSASPSSPPGAKRVGIAKFSRTTGGAGTGGNTGGKGKGAGAANGANGSPGTAASGADGAGVDGRPSTNLSAPTVTLRTEK